MQGHFMSRRIDHTIVWKLALLATAWLVWPSVPCRGDEYASEADIKKAIEKSKTFLLGVIDNDNADPGGAAIGTVALLKADVKPTDKAIKSVLDKLAEPL